eukprot:10090445-Heterocapsa_arctica.AAC.1
MLRNYIIYIQHTLVREDAFKNNNIKGSPTINKADKLSDLNKWDMMSNPAGTMSTVLGVGVIPRLSTVSRRKESSGEDNS